MSIYVAFDIFLECCYYFDILYCKIKNNSYIEPIVKSTHTIYEYLKQKTRQLKNICFNNETRTYTTIHHKNQNYSLQHLPKYIVMTQSFVLCSDTMEIEDIENTPNNKVVLLELLKDYNKYRVFDVVEYLHKENENNENNETNKSNFLSCEIQLKGENIQDTIDITKLMNTLCIGGVSNRISLYYLFRLIDIFINEYSTMLHRYNTIHLNYILSNMKNDTIHLNKDCDDTNYLHSILCIDFETKNNVSISYK